MSIIGVVKLIDGRRLLNLAEVAVHLDLSISTIRRRIADGALPVHIVFGRVLIDGDDLEALASKIDQKSRGTR